MSDISKIQLMPNNVYNIKDTFARNKISILENNRAIFFGDSYVKDGTIYNRLLNLLHATGANYSVNGTRWFLGENSFYQQMLNSVSQEQGNIVNYVIIIGGYNDIADDLNIYNQEWWDTQIAMFINKIRENYPYAKIIMVPGVWIDIIPTLNLLKLSAWIANACLNNGGISYGLASTWTTLMGNYNSGDNVHPNTKGYEVIASYIYNLIMGGNVEVNMVGQATGKVPLVCYRSGINCSFSTYFTLTTTDTTIFTLPSYMPPTTNIFLLCAKYPMGVYTPFIIEQRVGRFISAPAVNDTYSIVYNAVLYTV